MSFTDTRALVTGADSGIGQATAELLARAGADVAITYHSDADGIRETAAVSAASSAPSTSSWPMPDRP